MADDDVQLTDLGVIQQFSLAVRGGTAKRAAVRAALEADLAFLNGLDGRSGRGPRAAAPTRAAVPAPEPAGVPDLAPTRTHAAVKAPLRRPAKPAAKPAPKSAAKAVKKAPVSKAPVKKAAAKATRGRS